MSAALRKDDPPARTSHWTHAMNYRHAYHAGNFADIIKHVLFTRLIAYLKRKEKPFRVFDTHAGRGLYDLAGEEAERTGEAAEGIRRVEAASMSLRGDPLFADFFDALGDDVAAGRYPGSPMITRRLLRPQDRLSAYELHPTDADALKALFEGDVQVKAITLDGWLALGSHVPPKEKRGLVLIDPPFENENEIDTILDGLSKALRRWPSGTYALWYPLKRRDVVERLHQGFEALGAKDRLTAEFLVEPYAASVVSEARFVGSGLFVINPPYVFAEETRAIFNTLAPVLGRGANATFSVFASETRRS